MLRNFTKKSLRKVLRVRCTDILNLQYGRPGLACPNAGAGGAAFWMATFTALLLPTYTASAGRAAGYAARRCSRCTLLKTLALVLLIFHFKICLITFVIAFC